MNDLEKLNDNELAGLALDFFRRSMIHYGLWFNEVNYQLGLKEALQTESEVFDRYFPIMLKRLAGVLGFKISGNLPTALTDLPREKLIELIDASSANWLAADGIWFQAVETRQDMFTAKRCNDTCWTRFSPYEAHRIKALLNLPENGGLDALARALDYCLYARLNVQSVERDDNSLIFKMVNCRVQWARQSKGLDDYPCKSAGIIEHASFASAIDPRIKMECIGCPPDKHPSEWFCAWKFYIP